MTIRYPMDYERENTGDGRPLMTGHALCPLPFVRLEVSSEGDATFCCFQSRKCLGNVLETSIEEVWEGRVAREVRRMTSAGGFHPTCTERPGCPYRTAESQQPAPVDFADQPLALFLNLPNTHCNVGGESPSPERPACIMCERSGSDFVPEQDRMREVAERLRPLLPRTRHLQIRGIAEPFLEDRIFDVLEWIGYDEHRDRIHLTTTTNGTLLNEARRRRFLDRCPRSALAFSIDAGTPATYQRIRILPLYERVIENLMAYSKERGPRQELRIVCNINLLNVGEIPEMIRIAAEARVDGIYLMPTCVRPAEFLVTPGNREVFAEAHRKAEEQAGRLGVRLVFNRPLDTVDLPVFPVRTANPGSSVLHRAFRKVARQVPFVRTMREWVRS